VFDAKDRMTQIDGTDVWYKTYKVRNDARFPYSLSPNAALERSSRRCAKGRRDSHDIPQRHLEE
jgi:hypothetical protein